MNNQILAVYLTQMAKNAGADGAAMIKVNDIPFHREFRAACEQNACGKYGRCWMCPPDVGDIDEMIGRAKKYDNAIIFQTIWKLDDSFDIDNMEAAAGKHNELAKRLAKEFERLMLSPLKLGAGACHVCERCARLDDRPCRCPEGAVSSLEAYGIAVSELAELCGMKYINGRNTVTYFGGFLF